MRQQYTELVHTYYVQNIMYKAVASKEGKINWKQGKVFSLRGENS